MHCSHAVAGDLAQPIVYYALKKGPRWFESFVSNSFRGRELPGYSTQKKPVGQLTSPLKILQLSPRLPFPLTEGGNIGIYNITRQLRRRGAEIYFAAVSDRQDEVSVAALKNLCSSVFVAPLTKKYGLKTAAKNIFSAVPVNIEKYHSRKNLEQIVRFTSGEGIDLVHVDHLHMAYYGLAIGRALKVPVVLREHNLELKIMERFAATSPNMFHRRYAGLQLAKFKKYEPAVCAQFNKCIMITEEDRKRLLTFRHDIKTAVIPAGVDTEFFSPEDSLGEDDTIAYVGSLDWLPNVDGLAWFVQEVLPIVVKSRPSVRFYVYGKNPSRDVFKLSDGRNVIVKGFVDDVREVFRKARLMVVPLRAGSGIRIKILEAMAAGKAIVATSIGREGIKCETEKNIMVADGANEFAGKVLRLLGDRELCVSIGRQAARLASTEYSWERIGGMFWDEYSEIIGRHKELR